MISQESAQRQAHTVYRRLLAQGRPEAGCPAGRGAAGSWGTTASKWRCLHRLSASRLGTSTVQGSMYGPVDGHHRGRDSRA